jgi:hypothetical protein
LSSYAAAPIPGAPLSHVMKDSYGAKIDTPELSKPSRATSFALVYQRTSDLVSSV